MAAKFLKLHHKAEPEQPTFLLVGLGNPGREYQATRHNAGFRVVDCLCADLGVRMSRVQSKALIASGTLDGSKIVLAKPQTFMNLSGQSISGLLRFYKIPLDRLLVIHDDLDLPLGVLRLRPGGGSGGQKGLASTIQQLGTQDFPRLRVGIGRPPGRMDPSSYVLQDFSKDEALVFQETLSRACQAAKTFVLTGLEKAMNVYNGVQPNE